MLYRTRTLQRQVEYFVAHALCTLRYLNYSVEKFIEKNRLPHLLFYGPPGTGKTSTILAVARRIYGSEYKKQTLEVRFIACPQNNINFLQLNASDDRGIDVVREKIKQFAETRTLFSMGFKLIILDEADMMTQQAQAALRRVIEQYTKNVRFCIICNYVNKIAPAIQSRCTRFRFSPLPIVEVERRVNDVVEAEKCVESFIQLEQQPTKLLDSVNLTEDGKRALLKLSKGDMRRALSVLQACHAAYTSIGETEIYNCTGNPHPSDIETIVNSMLSDEFTTSYQSKAIPDRYVVGDSLTYVPVISAMKTERGLALQDLLSGTYEYMETIEFKPQARVYLLDFLSTTEYVSPASSFVTELIPSSSSSGIDYPLAGVRRCNYPLCLEHSKTL